MTKRLTTIIISLLLITTVWAQPYCTVRTFNIRDGLAANTISGIGQDSQQLMWFSTWNGLCCFDGYRFTTFRDIPGKNEVLTTNRLLMAVPNSENNIYCTTYDKRPYVFDTKLCKFIDLAHIIKERYGMEFHARKFYTLANGYTWIAGLDGQNIRIKDKVVDGAYQMQLIGKDVSPLNSTTISKVLLDESGREWIVTDKGTQIFQQKLNVGNKFEFLKQASNRVYLASLDGHLAFYNEKANKLTYIPLPVGTCKINDMKRFSSHQIGLATNLGVVLINTSNNQITSLSLQYPSQASSEIFDLHKDSKGRIWAFGTGLGVTIINPTTLSATWIPEEQPSTPYFTTSAKTIWVEDKYNTIWITPTKGYFGYYDEKSQVIKPYSLNSTGHSFVNDINKCFVDNQKNLWLTSSHDLTLVNLRTHKFKMIPLEQGRETRATCCDANGNRYFGTTSGNIIVADNQWNTMGYLSPQVKFSATPTPFDGKIYALFIDKSNRLWIGTKGGGLYVRFADGEIRRFIPNNADKFSINSKDIYTIDQDNNGSIWIGTYGKGINLAQVNEDKTIRFINSSNGLAAIDKDNYQHVRRITHTSDGTILVSTTDGLVTFSNQAKDLRSFKYYTNKHVQGDTTSLATSDVLQVLVTRKGKIFVATMSGGLQEIQGGKNLFSDRLKFKTINLPTSVEGIIQSLAEDKNGNIWITRESSIDMYNPQKGSISLFGPNDLGDHTEFCEAMPSVDANGEISLCAMDGVITFNPQHIQKSDYKPNIIFSAIQYQGETEPQPILYTDKLEIPASQRSFTISFAALDYLNNSMVRYAYKIKGIDKEWNYLSNNEHSVSYNHFPAGDYTLLVKSTNTDGVWVDNVKKLHIYAHPTFWETIWAKILYLLIFIGFLYAAGRYYVLKHKAAMEHDMTIMKTRFFTEIGHKLRTPLTLIGGPVTEVLDKETLSEQGREQMEMVQRNSRNMLELVNKILEHNAAKNYIVDDHNAPVFKQVLQEESTEKNKTSKGEATIDKSTRLLVVEDNDDLRSFLVSILSDQYTMLQAENGKKGLEIAIKEMPDFIITDVMMPVMDGLTMVHQIKQNKDICHIPIIVLSAKASLDDRLQGLNEGIDDYITKPFSATYLRHRVENIIAQRKMLQQSYLEQIVPEDKQTYKLESVQIVDADKEMMNQLMSFLEENISNTEIKIEDLANAVHLGRTVFYEKMKSIVGMSPIDFLRHIRLQRAEELVAKSSDTFSQIAYAVGFTDPKYFGKCFKKETGMTPSEYREKAKAEQA